MCPQKCTTDSTALTQYVPLVAFTDLTRTFKGHSLVNSCRGPRKARYIAMASTCMYFYKIVCGALKGFDRPGLSLIHGYAPISGLKGHPSLAASDHCVIPQTCLLASAWQTGCVYHLWPLSIVYTTGTFGWFGTESVRNGGV